MKIVLKIAVCATAMVGISAMIIITLGNPTQENIILLALLSVWCTAIATGAIILDAVYIPRVSRENHSTIPSGYQYDDKA